MTPYAHEALRSPHDPAGIVFALTLSLVLSAPAAAQQPDLPYGFHVGEPFPTIAFPALADGEPASIADFRGHRLILHVFASW